MGDGSRFKVAAAFTKADDVKYFDTLDDAIENAPEGARADFEKALAKLASSRETHAEPSPRVIEQRRGKLRAAAGDEDTLRSIGFLRRAHREGLIDSAFLFRGENLTGGTFLPISGGEAIPRLANHDGGVWDHSIRSALVIGLTVLWDQPDYQGEQCVLYAAPPEGGRFDSLGYFNALASSVKHWD